MKKQLALLVLLVFSNSLVGMRAGAARLAPSARTALTTPARRGMSLGFGSGRRFIKPEYNPKFSFAGWRFPTQNWGYNLTRWTERWANVPRFVVINTNRKRATGIGMAAVGLGTIATSNVVEAKEESELIIDLEKINIKDLMKIIEKQPELFFKIGKDRQWQVINRNMGLVENSVHENPELFLDLDKSIKNHIFGYLIKNNPNTLMSMIEVAPDIIIGKDKHWQVKDLLNHFPDRIVNVALDIIHVAPLLFYQMDRQLQRALVAQHQEEVFERVLTPEQKKLIGIKGTHSSKHIEDNIFRVIDETEKSPNIAYQFSKALEKEKELYDKSQKEGVNPPGIFYHGQMVEWGLLEDFVTGVARKYDPSIPEDYLFIQAPDSIEKQQSSFIHLFQKLKEFQKHREHQSLMVGSPTHDRQGKLFTNTFLMGGITNPDKVFTYSYVAENTTINSPSEERWRDIWKGILTKTGVPVDKQEPFIIRLNQLRKMLNESSNSGRLLQVVIPFDMIDKTAFFTAWTQEKGDRRIAYKTETGEEISGVSAYRQRMFEKPEEMVKGQPDYASQVVIPITGKFLLNPQSGVKVFSFEAERTPEQEKIYHAYQQGLKEVISDVTRTAEIEKKKQLKNLEKMKEIEKDVRYKMERYKAGPGKL